MQTGQGPREKFLLIKKLSRNLLEANQYNRPEKERARKNVTMCGRIFWPVPKQTSDARRSRSDEYDKEAVRKEQYMTTVIGVCHKSCVPRKERNMDKGKSREVGIGSQWVMPGRM